MKEDLLFLIRSMVMENRMSAREIAIALKKPYSTLMRECNPYDKGAKLGVETFFEVTKLTGDIEALRWIAHDLGYDLVQSDDI